MSLEDLCEAVVFLLQESSPLLPFQQLPFYDVGRPHHRHQVIRQFGSDAKLCVGQGVEDNNMGVDWGTIVTSKLMRRTNMYLVTV